MPRVTYEATPVVWITVRGEPQPDSPPHPDFGPLPAVPDDGGLYRRFREFVGRERISFLRVPGQWGEGEFRFAVHGDDVGKVIGWLREQGCTEGH